jgi:thermitase
MKNPKLIVGIIAVILLIGIIFVRSAPKKEQPIQAPPQSTEKVTNLVPKPSSPGKRIEGQIVVKFKANLTDVQINQYLQSYQAKIIKKIEGINRYVIQVPAGQEDTVLQQLSKDQIIENAEPDYEMHADFVPNDPLFSSQWGLANTGQAILTKSGKSGADIKAETAWNVTRGNGIKVAVIDSGINLNHPDFVGQIVAQRAYVANTVEDDYGHGTHVAGAIAALGNNAQGVTGVCPECKLIIAKVLDGQGTGSSSNVAAAMVWAADQGAKVINISAGGKSPTQTMQDAVDYVNSKGGIVVCSAGNDGDTVMTYPSALDSVVSVAATDNKDLLASFSTRGTWVKVAAPGVDIMSTLPTHTFNLQTQEPLKTTNDYLSGTSMAAPIVSGVLGLVWASPYGTSNTAVIQRLYTTADKTSGTGTYWAYGRVNAAKAVGADAVTPTPEPTQLSPTAFPTEGATPTVSAPLPTFTCLGACVTVSPSPALSPTEEEHLTAEPTEPSVPQAIPTPAIGTFIESIFKTKNCPGTPGLMSAFNKKGGKYGEKGGYSKGGKGGYQKGGYKKGGYGNANNCKKQALLEQLAKLITQLLAILFGQPQPQPAPAPVPTPEISPTCTPRPACLDATPACQIPITDDMCPPPSPTSELSPTEEPTLTEEPSPTQDISQNSFPSKRGD